MRLDQKELKRGEVFSSSSSPAGELFGKPAAVQNTLFGKPIVEEEDWPTLVQRVRWTKGEIFLLVDFDGFKNKSCFAANLHSLPFDTIKKILPSFGIIGLL